MAEPLTKVKLLGKASAKPLVKEDVTMADNLHFHGKTGMSVTKEEVVTIEKLKSALEEFQRLIFESFKASQKEFEVGDRVIAKITFERALGCMKEAFPAIYDKENGDKV